LKVKTQELPIVSVLLIGAGLYGTAVGLLAHFSVNYAGLYAMALLAPVLYKKELVVLAFSSIRKSATNSSRYKFLDISIVVMTLIHFSVALMPEVGLDALAMHLFVPNHLFYRHSWGFDASTYVWAVIPMLGDWIYSIVYMIAGEVSARLLNVGFVIIISLYIREFVIWAGGNSLGAKWAILIFLTTPLVFTETSSLFIESIWASFLVAGALSIFKLATCDDKSGNYMPVSGLLLAFSFAAKAVSFTVMPALLLVLIARYKFWLKKEYIYHVILGLSLFVGFAIIPYFTAWYLTGNPVFPFYNSYFKSSLWHEVDFKSAYNAGLTWDVLYQTLFHSEKYLESRPGAPGFQWIVLFFPALVWAVIAKNYRVIVLFGVAIVSIILTFNSTAYLRYIFPEFALSAAGIGVMLSLGLNKYTHAMKVLYVIAGLVIVLNVSFLRSATSYGRIVLEPIMSAAGRDSYLNKNLPIRNAVKLVNLVNSQYIPVAVFSSPLTAGLNADALYANWYNYKFQSAINKAVDSDKLVEVLSSRDVDYIILSSHWGTAIKRRIVENITTEIAEFSYISVRKLKSDYQFKTELIVSNDFDNNEWVFPFGKLVRPDDGVSVTVSKPGMLTVKVKSGKRYLNEVTAKCADVKAQGRVQVNWLNKGSGFISTDIIMFDCEPVFKSYSLEVIAPEQAVLAQVYAVGHTETPVIVNKVSFRK